MQITTSRISASVRAKANTVPDAIPIIVPSANGGLSSASFVTVLVGVYSTGDVVWATCSLVELGSSGGCMPGSVALGSMVTEESSMGIHERKVMRLATCALAIQYVTLQ